MNLFKLFRKKTGRGPGGSSLSLLGGPGPFRIEAEPFPYLVVENALEESVYEKLEKSYPSEEQIRGGKKVANRDQLMACDILGDGTYAPVWREFVREHTSRAFYLQLLELFAPHVRKAYPWLEEDRGKALEAWSVGLRDPEALSLPEICMDCQPGLNTVSLSPMTPRTAHLDASNKLFTGLFYMKPQADTSRGGDFLIYRLRTGEPRFLSKTTVAEEDLDVARVVPYQRNCAVFFMNSPLALHGVSVREGTPIPRRLVNVVGGLYTLKSPSGRREASRHQKRGG